ncbi:MAG: hypothetical protein ACYCX3_03710 [Thermoleophilia bacterium]
MPIWVLQTAAIVLGVAVLGFFAFASAYYARNRRLALAARDRALRSEAGAGCGGTADETGDPGSGGAADGFGSSGGA